MFTSVVCVRMNGTQPLHGFDQPFNRCELADLEKVQRRGWKDLAVAHLFSGRLGLKSLQSLVFCQFFSRHGVMKKVKEATFAHTCSPFQSLVYSIGREGP